MVYSMLMTRKMDFLLRYEGVFFLKKPDIFAPCAATKCCDLKIFSSDALMERAGAF